MRSVLASAHHLATAIFFLLVIDLLLVFFFFDLHSHSASDTLHPFLLLMVPAWLLAAFLLMRLRRRKR